MFSDNPNMRGAMLMMASMAGFVFNDAIMKSLSSDISLYQSIFIRGLFVTAIVFALAWRYGSVRQQLETRDRKILGWRSLGEAGSTLCYLTGLMQIPIAAAASIQQAVPLVITFIGAIWLGEKVGWRRYLAIGVGFIGVLLIVRPGADSFNIYVMFSVAGVAFLVLRDLATRQFSSSVSSLYVTLIGSLVVTFSSGLLSCFETWQPVTLPVLASLAAASGFIFFGYFCGVLTMRVGDIAFVSPFRYTVLIWAALLGYLVFDEVPDNYMLTGGLIIAMAGVYSFYRESRLQRSQG